MTTLDRSFIRAYAHDGPDAVLTRISQSGTADPANRETRRRATSSMPAPHVRFTSTLVAALGSVSPNQVAAAVGPSVLSNGYVVSVTTMDEAAAPQTPIADNAADIATDIAADIATDDDERDGAARAAMPLRAEWEVERFRWSDGTDKLAERAATSFDGIVEVLAAGSAVGKKVLVLLGERRQAGTTTLTLCLARRIAELGLSVAVVDADFAHPDVARQLGILPQFGWDDALASEADLAEAMVESLDDRLTALPLRTTVRGDELVCDAEQVSRHVQLLRRQFDLVLIDGGPRRAEDAGTHAVGIDLWQNGAVAVDGIIVVRDARDAAHTDAAGQENAERKAGASNPSQSNETPRRTTPRTAEYRQLGVVENFV